MGWWPGDEAWLVGEHRTSGEKKYYLSNLPAETSFEELAATIKARWVCEQAHQQLKEELGLDHFEGRSWTGLHRHALMTMIAFTFLQHLRLGEGKKLGRQSWLCIDRSWRMLRRRRWGVARRGRGPSGSARYGRFGGAVRAAGGGWRSATRTAARWRPWLGWCACG